MENGISIVGNMTEDLARIYQELEKQSLCIEKLKEEALLTPDDTTGGRDLRVIVANANEKIARIP